MQASFKQLFQCFVYGTLAIFLPLGIFVLVGASTQGASWGLILAAPFMLVFNIVVSGVLVAGIIMLGSRIRDRIHGAK